MNLAISPVKLYEEGSLTLYKQVGFSQEVIDFLDRIVWGTEETLYEHLETAKRVKNIKNPILVTLRQNGELMAMVLFIERQARFEDVSFKSYFARYLAANPAIRGTGLVTRGSALTMKLIRKDEKDPAIFYAVVEAKNIRSLSVVESVHYENISLVRTVGFNRLFPQKNEHVERAVDPPTREEILIKLEAFYEGHGFLNFDTLFIDDNYFVYRENGEIVAGIQAHKALWVISHLPGKVGNFIVKWAPKIPLIRRIINPKRFEFIALEGLYFQPKKMDQFFRLVEHVISEFGVYSALWWYDQTSPHYAFFRNSNKMGLLNKFVKDSDSLVMASFENMSEEQIEIIRKMPTYVSSYDFI